MGAQSQKGYSTINNSVSSDLSVNSSTRTEITSNTNTTAIKDNSTTKINNSSSITSTDTSKLEESLMTCGGINANGAGSMADALTKEINLQLDNSRKETLDSSVNAIIKGKNIEVSNVEIFSQITYQGPSESRSCVQSKFNEWKDRIDSKLSSSTTDRTDLTNTASSVASNIGGASASTITTAGTKNVADIVNEQKQSFTFGGMGAAGGAAMLCSCICCIIIIIVMGVGYKASQKQKLKGSD